MDTCLRKQLIVTCSARHIMIWNYAEYKFEVCWRAPPGEDVTAVAIHPSGFHIVAAVGDKLNLMNVLSNSIQEYTQVSLKACREIRFSNGGHMFAAGGGTYTYVYNFYTVELPANQLCKGHSGKITCIDWFEDDSGFADSCNQGLCAFYDLQYQRAETSRLKEDDFKRRNIALLGIANVPGATNRAVVASQERKLWDTSDHQNGCDTKYDISQVQILANGKALFAGVGQAGKPGAVQIWKFPLEMLSEVQAHSGPIERMRLTYKNDFLFTAGRDGALMIHEVKDKDPRGGLNARERVENSLPFSDEILTEKQEMDEIQQKRDQLKGDLDAAKDQTGGGVNDKNSVNDQDEKIKEMQARKTDLQHDIRTQIDQMERTRAEIEDQFTKQLKAQHEQNQAEMEARRNEYSQQMLEDAAKYQTLQEQQQNEARKFRIAQAEIYEEHTLQVNTKQKDHQDAIRKEDELIALLQENIRTMQRDNEETMRQICEDADGEKQLIQKKFEDNQNKVIQMTTTSKGEVQLTKNKLADVKQELKTLERTIQDKETLLKKQKDVIEKLKIEWTNMKQSIDERDQEIHKREKMILHLKKKTQELEKFKFVLDEKIRDLRKDIAPKEIEIATLRAKTRSLDTKLKQFNKVNASLGFMVEDLRVRQALIAKMIAKNRDKIRQNDTDINEFKNAVYQVVQHTDDHQQLKIAVNQSLFSFIKDQKAKNSDVNPNIRQEYENQKKFLMNSMHSLKKRLEIESQIHKADNLQIMTSNMDLIAEIGRVRESKIDAVKSRAEKDNEYKQLCTKNGIKPAKSLQELEDPEWLKENSKVLGNARNPIRSHDEETLFHMRNEREARRHRVEAIRQNIDELLKEQMQLEQFVNEF